MKKILINTVLIIGLSALFAVNACKDDIDPVIDELTYSRAFTPIGLKAVISSVTTVTLTWNAVKGTDHYVVEIYQGTDFTAANLITTANTGSATLVYNLPSGDTQFTARIKSVSSTEGVAESNWTSITFKTLPENLFTGYSVTMIGLGSLNVNWAPGKDVTKLVFINNSVEKSFDVSAAEALAGSKNVTGLTNGVNEIRVMNGSFVRGKQNYTLEGDGYLAAGGDLAATIAGMTTGGVLIVEPGASFGFTTPLTISQNIKIKGLNSTSLPTIYPAAGASTTNGMFYISASDSIVFENINITGYINNDVNGASGMVTGVFDQATTVACAISKVKFSGCKIIHMSRHLIRLRGTATQSINAFEVNNCILTDYGSNSTSYGVVNGNSALASIANIKFINSTVYNIQCGLVIYNASLGCQSVMIDNCTFDRLMLSSTARYFIDFGTSGTSSAGAIAISECVFGQTNTVALGVRNNLMTLSVTGSYYTTDFYNVTSPITTLMTAYSGLSTALWTDTSTGIFTFKDSNFAGKNTAGDPRWK